MNLSLESARHKFIGTIPYCAGPHYFFTNLTDFLAQFPNIPSHSMLGLWHAQTPQKLQIHGSRLIEALTYDDGSFHLYALKKPETDICIEFPQNPKVKSVSGITLGFICTADEPYLSLFRESLVHYQQWLPKNVEISVVLFGEAVFPQGIKVHKEPIENFSMAHARNLCLQNATYDHMFLLDVDVRMGKLQFDSIVEKFQQLPNAGVFNLKNHPHLGNGLYFGDRYLMAQNGYDERFQKYWGEDTEHLMNYSRKGIIPMVVFEAFERVNHPRDKTLAPNLQALNFNLMSNILNSGSRQCNYP